MEKHARKKYFPLINTKREFLLKNTDQMLCGMAGSLINFLRI